MNNDFNEYGQNVRSMNDLNNLEDSLFQSQKSSDNNLLSANLNSNQMQNSKS